MVDRGGRRDPTDRLLAFLRLKNLNGADAFLLEPVFIDTVWQEHLQLPVSEANEKAALQEVGERCEAALKTFGSTVQADFANARGGGSHLTGVHALGRPLRRAACALGRVAVDRDAVGPAEAARVLSRGGSTRWGCSRLSEEEIEGSAGESGRPADLVE